MKTLTIISHETRAVSFDYRQGMVHMSLLTEQEDWARRMLGYVPWVDSMPIGCLWDERPLTVHFRSTDDAMAFALRWDAF